MTQAIRHRLDPGGLGNPADAHSGGVKGGING